MIFDTPIPKYLKEQMEDFLKSPEWLDRRRSSKVVAEEARERGRRALENLEDQDSDI